MKRLVIAVFAAVVGLSLMVPDAEAARLGGGRSSGMQRQAAPTATRPAIAPAPAAAAAPAAVPAKPAGMRRFLGPLAGLAAGLGIAALLSHFGMGEGMANMLMILALVMAAVFVVRWLMSKRTPPAGAQYAGASPGNAAPANFNPAAAQFEASGVGAGAAAATAVAANIPADFDVEGFLRQAKLNFVRLQAANDRGDMDDIRQFTAPEMFAEIQMQYKERGGRSQETDVMALNADLLEVVTEDNRHIASVRFSGQLREEANAAPQAFTEIWHLTKPVDGSRGWNVAGIQQVQ
ncbi:MAG: Tim44-like domain-containing protein [Sulfuritalea sp.]|jgi:predicted lipid-binding transport protein (Tim44 family)|nr:Tim44-like domain-containing protein [Sulfuritalea sp.]